MNTQPIENITERISLFISDNYAEPRWVEIDTTGAAPETTNGFERATGADAAVPIYRSPALTRSRYAMLEELVKISSGIAPAEGAHREQMRALRERVEAAEAEIEERAQELSAGAVKRAMARADDAHQRYEAAKKGGAVSERAARAQRARSLAAELRTEKIIEEARRWKRRALAADAEADTLHAAITSAEMRARVAERDRDLIERKLDDTLNVLRQNREILATERTERLDAETRISDAQAKALSTIEKIANLIPAPESAELPPFEISTYYGTDNVPVVEIDTQMIEGRLRINLNDAPIWDGDPETDERPGANLPADNPAPNEAILTVQFDSEVWNSLDSEMRGKWLREVEDAVNDIAYVSSHRVNTSTEDETNIRELASRIIENAYPAPRQSMKATISKQLEAIRDRDARIEELEEDLDGARAEAKHLREQLDAASSRGLKIEARFDSVLAKPAQIEAALRIIACGKITYNDALELAPNDSDPLAAAHWRAASQNATHLAELHQTAYEEMKRLAEQRQESIEVLEKRLDETIAQAENARQGWAVEVDRARGERDQARLDATAADEMRRKLDERLADVTRAGAITAAGLRAMIRQRDELLRRASDLAERVTEGGTGGPSSGDLLAARELEKGIGLLPKLDDEPTSRADESVLDLVRVCDKVVRFWRAAPTSVVTEQLNIALAELANLTKR